MNRLRSFRFYSSLYQQTSFSRTFLITSKRFEEKKAAVNEEIKKVNRRKVVNLLFAKKVSEAVMFLFLAFAGYMSYKRYKASKDEQNGLKIENLVDPKFKNGKLIKTNVGDYVLPEYLKKNLPKFKLVDVRNDDVWIVSFPKSGTTWIQEIVYLIVNDCNFEKAKSKSIEVRMPFIDMPTSGLNSLVKLESPRIIKTHLPKPFLPDDIEKKCKVYLRLEKLQLRCILNPDIPN